MTIPCLEVLSQRSQSRNPSPADAETTVDRKTSLQTGGSLERNLAVPGGTHLLQVNRPEEENEAGCTKSGINRLQKV